MATSSAKITPTMGEKWVLKDLTGQTFGRLTVLDRYPVNHSHGNARWVVECSCGTIQISRSCHLLNGHATSCGCWNEEKKRLKGFTREIFVRHMFDRYRKAAARRDVFWNLTVDQVDGFISGNCFYCGVEPQFRNAMRGNIGAFLYNGIDRLANYLGYFPENCVSCCGVCNIAKQDMPLHQFMTWLARVSEHQKIAA